MQHNLLVLRISYKKYKVDLIAFVPKIARTEDIVNGQIANLNLELWVPKKFPYKNLPRFDIFIL